MDRSKLGLHVDRLIHLPETETPVLSCYLPTEGGEPADRPALNVRLREIRESVVDEERPLLDEAIAAADSWLGQIHPESKGVAIFARGGSQPFLLGLQFRVPLPTWVALDSTPNIYHLVELKETYDRYIVVIVTETVTRILEVNLGSVTQQLWFDRPELRRRVGREWTQAHYESHRRDRSRRFLKEQVELIKRLAEAGGHTHIVIAGAPREVGVIRRTLPSALRKRIVEVGHASGNEAPTDVVARTLAPFIAAKGREQIATSDRLFRELRTGGLAVAGGGVALRSLGRAQVDTLILSGDWGPIPGWRCATCDEMDVGLFVPDPCPRCGAADLQYFDAREEMVKLAEREGCGIEIVAEERLTRLGGVGVLLRYRSR
ncbi:MAG: host attachment protein [Deltaproteobacteria bacterium]|nr:host attachment protein [Deltaproteobacteria bacterium]MBW2667193.1 host attachment protein [Deltaproteobacteria bacterium]